MTLNGAIMELVLLSEHPMMPVIFRPAIQKVIETISELEAQPKQRWVPVTERLPEEDGRYLVCGAKGGIYHANYRGRWWTQVGCGGKLVPSVVAWMPLPKPWKGDAE